MGQDPRRPQRELISEERRAVIWLGILAALVGFRFWVHDDNTFNFACNYPCPHVTFTWVPVLNLLLYSWLLYAACMLVYFSEDILWEHDQARRIARRVGHGFLIIWPTTFAFVIAFSEGTYLIENWPQWIQFLYLLLALELFGRMIFWYIETVSGQRRLAKRWAHADAEGLKVIAELVIEGLIPILEGVVKRLSKGKIPKKLLSLRSRVLKVLARRRGRVKIRYWQRKKS